jgi:hypothetical protein
MMIGEREQRLIVHLTAAEFGVSPEDLMGARRDHIMSMARHVAIYVMRTRLYPHTVIGRFLSRDHTTSIYAARKMERIMNGVASPWQRRIGESVVRIIDNLEKQVSPETQRCPVCNQIMLPEVSGRCSSVGEPCV